MEQIAAHNLFILNTGEKPTFARGNSTSFIDVTVCNDTLSLHVKNWMVLNEESCTDHNYIILFDRFKSEQKKRNTINVVDWELFRAILDCNKNTINANIPTTQKFIGEIREIYKTSLVNVRT